MMSLFQVGTPAWGVHRAPRPGMNSFFLGTNSFFLSCNDLLSGGLSGGLPQGAHGGCVDGGCVDGECVDGVLMECLRWSVVMAMSGCVVIVVLLQCIRLQ